MHEQCGQRHALPEKGRTVICWWRKVVTTDWKHAMSYVNSHSSMVFFFAIVESASKKAEEYEAWLHAQIRSCGVRYIQNACASMVK